MILVGIYIVLSLADWKGEYAAEKTFWKSNKKYNELIANSAFVPDQSFDDLISEYEQFMGQFPKSSLIPTAQMTIGKMYVAKKEYNKAREVFESLLIKYPDNQEIDLKAYSALGRTYLLESNIQETIKIYNRVIHDYPLSDLGLRAPLLKARLFLENNQPQEAQTILIKALDYYNQLKQKNANTPVEYRILWLTSSAYQALNRWKESVTILSEMLERFTDPMVISQRELDDVIKSINIVCISELKNFDLAIGVYEDLIKNHPQHPFVEPMKMMIRNLKKFKKEKPLQTTS